MSDTTDQADEAAAQPAPLPPSPGPLLRAAREKAGLKTQAIAKELHINTGKLEALERDDYDRLPSDVFVQGYVRRYAKLVGLDEQELADTFTTYRNALRASRGEEVEEPEPQPTTVGNNLPRWVLPTGVLGGAALLIVITVWFSILPQESARRAALDETPEPAPAAAALTQPANTAVTESDSTATAIAPAAVENAEFENSGIESSEIESTEAAIGTDTDTERDSTTITTEAQAPAPDIEIETDAARLESPESTATAYSEGKLTLSLSEDCWVKITDATGEVIYARLVSAGESVDITGLVPMEVMLGNARAAELSFNGALVPVNLRPGYDTAKVIVGG